MSTMNFKEITIPVPWGHIAAKTCGVESNEMILILHGYRDNANSFDYLIPKLPSTYYYVSIDLPGHGKSSHISSSSTTTTILTVFDFIFSLKLLVEHFGRKQYIFLCHSYGAQLAMLFTQTYPEYTKKLICLDVVYFPGLEPDVFITHLRTAIDGNVKLTKQRTEPPAYRREEAVERLISSRVVPISKENALHLIDRSLQPIDNEHYRLTTDQHLKYSVRAPTTFQYYMKSLRVDPIKCPHLLILATESLAYFRMFEPILDVLKQNKQFQMHIVQGTHDVHMEHPQRVATIIDQFLSNDQIILLQNNKL